MTETADRTATEEHKTATRIYVDVETTGLDPDQHEILDVAIVVESVPYPYTRPGTIVSQWSQKTLPKHIENAEPDALRVNGYTPEAWADAVPFEDVMPKLLELFEIKGVWIGHNPSFDRRFIVNSLKRQGVNVERAERHRLGDTTTVAYLAWGLDGRFKCGMNALRKYLGLSEEGAHGALKDCFDCREVFYRGIQGLATTLWAAGFAP